MDLRRPLSRRLALGAGGLSLLAACAPARVVTEDGSYDLLTMLRDKPEYTRFVNALTVSGQAGRIGRQNGAVTLFVPVDSAMNGLPPDLLRLLDSPPSSPSAEQRALVATFVNANAAFGLLRLADMEARRNAVTTWDRARLNVARTGQRTATITRVGAPAGRAPVQITRADILGSDGVFHVTSAPILP
ncbi:fasciclin domain-containing protein [Falsiroseomonas sp. HW251]|uniref:fasciclin domain-containing protein n=1 Tax=Falsiroseomonas sp. HW251 TaxID=3390998 RepID=UPI003D313B6D